MTDSPTRLLEAWRRDGLSDLDRGVLRDHLSAPDRALEELGGLTPGDTARLLAELLPHARRDVLPAVGTFTGRERELWRCVEHVMDARDGGVAVIVLCGEEGVGKTETALRLAQLLSPSHPDVQLLSDLRPGGFPLEGDSLRVAGLRKLRPRVEFPPERGGLEALYHHALDGHGGLHVLDDASDADQIRQLLCAPAGWTLIVTTPRPLGLDGSLELELGRLEAEAARHLAGSLTASEAEAERCVEMAGGHPLALRLAAAGALESPGAGQAAGDLEGVLAVAVDALAAERPELAALLARLALMPTTFDPPMAASLTGLPVDRIAGSLEELAARGFLRIDGTTGLVDLHRALGRWLLDSELAPDGGERATLRRRYAGRLLAAGGGIHRLYLEDGEARRQACDHFEQLWPHLHAAWCWMLEDPSPESDRFLSELPLDYGPFLLNHYLTPYQQEHLLERSLEAAKRLGDRRAVARHLGSLGAAFHQRKAKRQAIEHYERALEEVRELGDRTGEINLLGNLGELLRDPEELERAAALHRRQLELARELGSLEWETWSLGSLANALWRNGRVLEATEAYEECLEGMRRLGDRRGEAQVLGNLGLCHASLERHGEALPYYRRALEVSRELDDGHAEWIWLDMMGEAHLRIGETEEALERARQAVACAQHIGRKSSEMLSTWRLGEALVEIGELEEGLAHLEAALAYERSVSHKLLGEHAARYEEVRRQHSGAGDR